VGPTFVPGFLLRFLLERRVVRPFDLLVGFDLRDRSFSSDFASPARNVSLSSCVLDSRAGFIGVEVFFFFPPPPS